MVPRRGVMRSKSETQANGHTRHAKADSAYRHWQVEFARLAATLLHRSMSLFTERRNCEASFELVAQDVGSFDEVPQ
jgi:hypothetical protein